MLLAARVRSWFQNLAILLKKLSWPRISLNSHIQSFKTTDRSTQFPQHKTLFPHMALSENHHHHHVHFYFHVSFPSPLLHQFRSPSLSIHSALASSSSLHTSKDVAIHPAESHIEEHRHRSISTSLLIKQRRAR
ncbi:hypothetical protein NC653_004244 [Populus alba x Populus x berolinensis]|uniref:Uncharacterized protein n=1 Tax=Populus alba x Populus x berolinensis TaxID=444605 RepID=A0AAD6WJI3_9ROSI|nr:hypothetical protein NC653_004244 [Populus alba x Populus x berolinensis]